MSKLISVKDISYKVQDVTLINSLSLDIDYGEFISIVGPSGSCKSTLIKILFDKLKYNSGFVEYYKDNNLADFADINDSLGIVFDKSYNSFVCDKVYDELVFNLKQKGYSKDDINIIINDLCDYFDINDLLYCIPSSLSNGQKQLIALLSIVATEPSVLVIDDAFDMVDSLTKEKILFLLKKLNRDKKTTIIYLTQDIEWALYSKRMIVMSEGNIVADDKTKEVIKQPKLFKVIGLNLSFMMDLSNRLQYYGLIDEIELDMDKLVDKLWK